ncbi:MAG: 50S ribosomal protein L9 [Alphaproteobacteria bacterium]
MEVVLLERVEKLGQMGDVVTVKPGFARNYLLPRQKALRATKENMARFERERAQLEARNLERKEEAERVGRDLDGKSFVVIRQAGESGQLYGSVSARDIAAILTEEGFSVDRGQIVLERPIKSLGLHEQRVELHGEVIVSITVNVARSEEEAVRQARGEDVTAEPSEEEEEEGLAPEEVFEEGALEPEEERELEQGEEEAEPAEPGTEPEPESGTEEKSQA